MPHDREISIWFFVGVALVVNGLLVLGAGVYEFVVPPANPVVLANLHAPIWWGALMSIAGAAYTYRFAPQRAAASTPNAAADRPGA
jgi:hypothetical protein